MQSFHEIPRQIGRKEARAGQVDAIEVRFARDRVLKCKAVTCGARSVVHAPHAKQRLPILRRQNVDRDDDRRTARMFRTFGQCHCDLPLVRRIELEPNRPVARGNGVLDRGGE
jgi:hypothetical protein